jgi:hypothetical protein
MAMLEGADRETVVRFLDEHGLASVVPGVKEAGNERACS